METFYRARKVVVCVLFIVALFLVFDALASPFDELKGGKVTFQGVCTVSNGMTLPCVEITNGEKVYIVFFDDEGEVAMYQKIHDKFVLIWARNSI